MKGLLCFEGTPEELLIFVCDLCHQQHCILVSTKGPYVKSIYGDKLLPYNVNVWGYKLAENNLAVYPNLVICKDNEHQELTCELHPSMDNSEYCGKHTGVTWFVEVKILKEDQFRTPKIEEWLVS